MDLVIDGLLTDLEHGHIANMGATFKEHFNYTDNL
jgi:hypothetical protein